ncbi:MAG: aspartate aminotransferase family protein [Clostridia bacterium]|nr:aspartate aminotransferase family protein [Clostridia bacterium]
MNLNEIIETDAKYYLNTFGKRTPVCFERGEGIYLYDTEGNKYTDFFAGIAVNVLGHSHPAIVEAITKQASKIIHCSNLYYIEPQAKLAKMICENSCAEKVFFANSGAEANEGAIKLVRAYYKKKGQENRSTFICLDKSFHGRTITTATATGQDKYKMPYTPLTPGFKHVPINDIKALKAAVDDTVCGIMLEPVQGESGVYPLEREYAEEVRRICDKNDIMLIFDEVQTGVGRTGKLFGYMTLGVEPDVFTLAKALGGGVPIGCLCAKGRVTEGFVPGDHGTTFGGNPLACAAGLASLGTVIEENLSQHAEEVGAYMRITLEAEKEALGIKEIRNRGLMFGIEFKEPVAADVKNKLFEQKWLVGAVGSSTLRVLPPLIIENNDVDEFVKALKRSI